MMIISCKSTTDSNPTGTSTTYAYTGKDSLGTVFVTGTITIPHPDSSSQSGTWKWDSVGGIPTRRFGPQFGTGIWIGGLVSGKLMADMNPYVVDNNVLLSGIVTSSQFSGSWSYSTLVGTVNRGSFVAVRQ